MSILGATYIIASVMENVVRRSAEEATARDGEPHADVTGFEDRQAAAVVDAIRATSTAGAKLRASLGVDSNPPREEQDATIERLKVDLETKSVVHLCCEIVERVKVLHRESDSGGWCIQQEGGSNEVWPCPTSRALSKP